MYSKVYVEITNICNMNCSFCHGHSRPLRKMSTEEFRLILDRLTGHTEYLYYHLMGEPLTHPQLPAFIKMAGTRGYKSIITTNGTLLCDLGDELLAAGVNKINVSLHSWEDGDSARYAQHLRNLADFAKKAAEAGTVVVFRLWNQDIDDGKNDFIRNVLKQSIDGEWVENTRGIRIRRKLFIDMAERFEWPDRNAGIRGDRYACYGLKDHFGILVDGTVVPCCLDSDGIIALGNIFQEDITDIVSSQRALAMINGFKCGKASEDLCRRCSYAQRFVR